MVVAMAMTLNHISAVPEVVAVPPRARTSIDLPTASRPENDPGDHRAVRKKFGRCVGLGWWCS
jgi:hypothetical protein